MIKNFVKISVKNDVAPVSYFQTTKHSISLKNPCNNHHKCEPYLLLVRKGVYKFECWGSTGSHFHESEHGLGAYTSGIIALTKHTKFYVYIGQIGFFNAVKKNNNPGGSPSPGGATDVRLVTSLNWWDEYSLISRIMVAAGGGSAEWIGSIAGHGGELVGGNATNDEVSFCEGGKQNKGSKCYSIASYNSEEGKFGCAGLPEPVKTGTNDEDYGGFGGGGYYGGTSYQIGYAGSGGSSFISGHKGCNAVKERSDFIEHTNDSVHYSGLIFSNTTMIGGNKTMPIPNSISGREIWTGTGAFRITLLQYQYECTYKKPIYTFHLLFLVISFSK